MVFTAMWLDYREEIRAFNSEQKVKLRPFPEKDLVKALDEFLEVKRQEALAEIMASVKCSGENRDELKRFLFAVTGKYDEVELAMLAHLIWQVKRKMFSKKVFNHTMVIFKGLQGAGKTEAIKMLFNVIRYWFNGASLKEITDDRWKFFFKTSFVIFCDELQHAEWASVDALKNIISANEFASRKLGTNIYDVVAQNCTFVGATNKPVGELIKDGTGMRRFFELQTLPKMDWDIINTIDYIKIWQGVDENREEPYIAPFKDKILEKQQELILPDPEDEFIHQFDLLAGSKAEKIKFVQNNELYQAYSVFTRQNGERQKPSISFHRSIKGKGLEAGREGKSGVRGYYVTQKSYDMVSKFKGIGHGY